MKKITLLIILMLIIGKLGFAQIELSIIPKIGVNVVDIEKATGTFKYENAPGGTYLNAWNTLNYGVSIEAVLKQEKKWNLGGELTYNRLYYWEEAYETFYGREYRWGEVGTIGIGILYKYNLNELFYFKPMLSLEIFTGGSGMAVSTGFAAGTHFKISDKVSIPIEVRTQQIFGSAVSLLFNAGTGLMMTF